MWKQEIDARTWEKYVRISKQMNKDEPMYTKKTENTTSFYSIYSGNKKSMHEPCFYSVFTYKNN